MIDTSSQVKLNFKRGLFYETFQINASFASKTAVLDGNSRKHDVFKTKDRFMRLTFDYFIYKTIYKITALLLDSHLTFKIIFTSIPL